MKNKRLIDRLLEYSRSDYYPFHMPGHKRQTVNGLGEEFPNPFFIDITEIEGFDNLHHPEGILKDSMEWAASVYGADRTYYLVNGSSCGILSAVCGAVCRGGKILMSRNCHKSAYHGVFLNDLKCEYIYPHFIEDFGINGGISAEDVDNLLDQNPDAEAVLVVSPTYDGVVSDIRAIAEAVHRRGIALIVDEAHGAHFSFNGKCLIDRGLPESALKLGADVVIQSLHKTLPSLTQTALLHIKGNRVDRERIERYLQIYQSSSPSYVMMASVENCIDWMDRSGRKRMAEYLNLVKWARTKLGTMRQLKLLDQDMIGKMGVYDLDITKIVISCKGTCLDGMKLANCLRETYHLEMEMCGADYIVALSSLMDSKKGLERLVEALLEVDEEIEAEMETEVESSASGIAKNSVPKAELSLAQMGYTAVEKQKKKSEMKISEAMEKCRESVAWDEAEGRISAEFVYIYPPGIPITAPGERIERDEILLIEDYIKKGLPVQGLRDESLKTVQVVKAE